MACPHASGCPLFPYLNASLDAWRLSYCDHENGWRGCARYVLSGQGKPVPLALLPNGRMPVSMLPHDDRTAALEVAHQLRPGVLAREFTAPPGTAADGTAADGTASGAVERAAGGLRSSLRRRRTARSGAPDAVPAPGAVSAVAALGPEPSDDPVQVRPAHATATRRRTETVVDLRETDWTRQDWVPSARAPWWRRLTTWLGGME